MKDIIIKSGNIINPGGEVSGYHDIYIKDGIIIGIDEDNTKLNSPIIIDAENCIICPGLVDLSVRFRQPGLEKEATILSESMAAVSSGVTTVCYMPDTQPVIDTPAQIKLVEEIFKNVNLYLSNEFFFSRKIVFLTFTLFFLNLLYKFKFGK